VVKSQFKDIADFAFRNRLKRWVFLLIPSRFSVWLFRRILDRDKERNSLLAAKFLVDAQKLYPSKYYLLLPKFLRFALRLAHTCLPNTYLRLFINSVFETRRHPAKRKLNSEYVYQATRSLDRRQSTAHGWKLISLALTGFGFIRAGTVARKYCLEASLEEVKDGKASSRTLRLAIEGLLEGRRFEEAIKCIEFYGSNLDSNSIDRYVFYLDLLQQRRPDHTAIKFVKVAPKNNTAQNLITDKSVALLATGEITTLSGNDIDQHDVVARIKFQGFNVAPPSAYAGTRCDVTSFNQDLATSLVAKFSSNPKSIDFLNVVKLIFLKQANLVKLGSIPVQNMQVWAPTFLTTATSGTLLIFELLMHRPKSLKLFAFDFYTKRSIYNAALMEYFTGREALREISLPKNWFDVSTHQKRAATISHGFIPHDPRSDFLLVKNLYEMSGLIDGTPEVLEILNLTADEFDARLEETLGDW
jgi:hypothetical protein